MMAHTVADLEGLQAERIPDEIFTMTSQQWRLAVVAELVPGSILGWLFLGTHSLFLDESVSSALATAPWHRFANVVSHREANTVLYYLLWPLFMLARSPFGRRTALIARSCSRSIPSSFSSPATSAGIRRHSFS
jgi:hypothetical protein